MNQDRQLCTFQLGNHFCGVDVQTVQEVIRYQEMTNVPLAPSAVSGLINLRGQIVTAIDLRRCLELEARDPGALPMNIVVRDGDGAVSLLVDSIGDVQHVSAEDFEPAPETIKGPASRIIVGAYKLPGRLLLLLDTAQAIEIHEGLPV